MKGVTESQRTAFDNDTLRSAWEWLLGQTDPVNLEFLAVPAPQALAGAITDPEKRTWAAHALAVLPFVDGSLDTTKVQAAEAYFDALGIHEDFVAELQDIVSHRLSAMLACMMRENMLSLHGAPVPNPDALAYFLPYQDRPNPDLEARHLALAQSAPETLGRHYHDWYVRNGFPFPGNARGLTSEFAWPHDTTHLLSGYNTTPHGELLVSTFTAGMHPDQPMEGHILPVIFSWHAGIQLNPIAKSARGASMKVDVFEPGWDFWAACAQPIDELRQQYGVPPSAYPFERVSA
jgi:hypothetical protein